MIVALWGAVLFALSVGGAVAGLILWFTRNGNWWSKLLIADTLFLSFVCFASSAIIRDLGEAREYRRLMWFMVSLGAAGGVLTTIGILLANLSHIKPHRSRDRDDHK